MIVPGIHELTELTELASSTQRDAQIRLCSVDDLPLLLREMATKDLPKVADVEEESQYGYVFGVSGPGKLNHKVSQ